MNLMKKQNPVQKEKSEKSSDLALNSLKISSFVKDKTYNDLTENEINQLTPDDLEYLRIKNQGNNLKPTVIGKKPYEPFLAGDDEVWMSVGDEAKGD